MKVWLVIEYDPDEGTAIRQVCSSLGMASSYSQLLKAVAPTDTEFAVEEWDVM